MAYKNKLDHSHFGEVWYEVTLRNWNALGNTVEQNLEMGPLFEGRVLGTGVVRGADTLEAVEKGLSQTLDIYGMQNQPLPEVPPKWGFVQRLRLKWLFSKWEKNGSINPVK